MGPLKCKPQVIVFDLDGTLVNSMPGFTQIAADVIHKYFGVERGGALKMYRDTTGLPFLYQLRTLFPGQPHILEAETEYEERKLKNYMNALLFPDVPGSLADLVRCGYRLCVSSNNHEKNVSLRLKAVRNYFSLILGYRGNFMKGQAHFNAVLEYFGVARDALLFIGDSLNDARIARESGVPFAARLGTFSADDFNAIDPDLPKFKDFPGLTECLKGL